MPAATGISTPADAATTTAPSTQTTRAYLALLFGVLCIGFSAIFARWADAPGVVVATWRVGVASVVLLIPFLRQPPAARPFNRSVLLWSALGGAFFAADTSIWNASLDYTSAANATFLVNVTPVLVGLITVFFLGKKLPPLFWPGMVVVLAGAALMLFNNGGDRHVQQGDLMALSAAVFWAGYQLVTRRARATLGVGTLTYLWLMVTTATLVTIPITLLSGASLCCYDTNTMLALLGVGLISQTAGYIGLNYALGHLPTPRVSVTILLQPVITAIAAFAIFGEVFTGWPLVGGMLILLGIYVINRSQTSAEEV